MMRPPQGGMGQLGGMARDAMQRPEVQQGMQQARGWLQGAGMPQTMGGMQRPGMPQMPPGAAGGFPQPQVPGGTPPMPTQMPAPMGGARPNIDPQMLAQMLGQRR
jgi:hypothetical protein